MTSVDIADVRESLARAAAFLEQSFLSQTGTDSGGWYHRLNGPRPGPTATAVGLRLSNVLTHGTTKEEEAINLLESRITRDPVIQARGWAVNITDPQPVVEATAWVVRSLLTAKGRQKESYYELARAGAYWLKSAQNGDGKDQTLGGWGSFPGVESRTFTTSAAVIALARHGAYESSVVGGANWLLAAQRPRGGWSELNSNNEVATPIHTAYAIDALLRSGVEEHLVRRSINFLLTNLETGQFLAQAHVENYLLEIPALVVGGAKTGGLVTNIVPHYTLPTALHSLMLTSAVNSQVVAEGIETLLEAQMQDGKWPAADSAEASIWPLCYSVRALTQYLQVFGPVGNRTSVLHLRDVTLVMPNNRSLALTAVREIFFGLWSLIRRHPFWTSAVLTCIVVLTLTTLDAISWKDALWGLAVPIVPVIIERILGTRDGQRRKPSTN